MKSWPRFWQYFRRLRVRLALAYAILFSVFLTALGVVFREVLAKNLENTVREVLEEEWVAAKGYIKVERGRLIWFYDPADPDETLAAERLRHVYLLTNAQGKVLGVSPIYHSIGINSQAEIQKVLRSNTAHWEVRRSEEGVPYLIRSGALMDEGKQYFLAIGRSLAENEKTLAAFTRNYFTVMPAFLLVSVILGWFLTARALKPVNDLAEAAHRISSSNLDMRIPPRGAHDEIDRLIESFNRMMERLEQSFQQLRQFTTDASHELRTPLTAIRGQLEVALFTARTEEQYREAMLNAMQDVERLSAIVKSLLLLSQAESGQLVLQKADHDLCRAVLDLVDQFQIPAAEQGVTLQTDLPPVCHAEVDLVQFDRLVANLLSNAVKYTPRGGNVTVTLREEGDFVALEVADTGRGIPEAALPHIFDRFYRVRTDESSGERGLGLGLSFVAWIVKAHEGAVEVHSKPGEGSTFIVRLPKRAPERSLVESAMTPPPHVPVS